MESWTGKTGEEEKAIRRNGKNYILAYYHDGDILKEITENEIKDTDWDDWCNVCARSLEEAKKNYDEAFLQWRQSQDVLN